VYEAKFIFDNRYCKSVILMAIKCFWLTVDYLELPEGARKYGRKVSTFPIMEALMVTSNQQVVTYEIGVYIDNQYMYKFFSKGVILLKNTKA
jgi:hypothetical protein